VKEKQMEGIQCRNKILDIYKGILICLVVIRHALQYSVSDEGTILSNIIWSVQMPGFMMVSGYFSARECLDKHDIFECVKKNTRKYFLPFIAWYILLNTFLNWTNKEKIITDIGYLFHHIDNGLWFLWVIYILSFAAIFCNYICSWKKVYKIKIVLWVLFCAFFVGGIAIGGVTSFSGFGIKFILYYSVYYGFGWLVKMTQLYWKAVLPKIKDAGLFICFCVWIFIVWNFDLYHCEDKMFFIALRCVAGFAGNAVILSSVIHFRCVWEKIKLAEIGQLTLEIYVTHTPLNHLFISDNNHSFFTVIGFENFLFSLFSIVFFSMIIIMALKSISYANWLFYGKTKDKM